MREQTKMTGDRADLEFWRVKARVTEAHDRDAFAKKHPSRQAFRYQFRFLRRQLWEVLTNYRGRRT